MAADFLRKRVGLLVVAALLALGVSLFEGGSSAADAPELAAALGRAAGGVVRPEDFRWEPSGGVASDLATGRFVLFLASDVEGGPRDLHRARVRITPEGHVLAIGAPRNLTATPLGDDHALVIRGSRAAYATFAFGQEQSVTALDLEGEGAQNLTRALHDRVMAWVTNVQLTGSGEGIGRIDVTLDQPANRVGLAVTDSMLEIALADDARSARASRTARLDLAKGELAAATPGMHADLGRHLPKRLVFWAVDTVRAVPWIGPAPIAWLEERTFAVRDTIRKTAFKVTAGGEALAVEPEQVAPPMVLDASQASADLGHWPPPNIRSMWKTPEPGEGEWEAPKQPWVKKVATDAPSPFYRAYVRPDEDRPYAKVLLVAMDTRQLDLEMEAGNEDPKPLTGPPGAGRIPRDPAVYTRIAAAFNGGFKTEHGQYGMMLKKRVLLPPVPGIATVIITKDARYGLGSWGTNRDVGGIQDVDAAEIISFRQNLDPLVDNDKVNPLGRAQWGYTLPGTTMQTERSGLCVTNAGHLLYAWGDDVSATTLGKAMKMASCIYGMHLDMNPHHTGFLFTNIGELKRGAYKSELLTNQMEIDTARFIEYAPKDFFYMTMHDPTPPAIESEGERRSKWEPDPGVQPAPSWMAGLWRTVVGGVEVLDIEPARASFRVRAGTKEPDAKTGAARAHELDADDAHRVLFALTLGASETKHPRGLVTDGKIALAVSGAEHHALLTASEEGALTIVSAKELSNVPRHVDAVELPLLLEDGKEVKTHGGGGGMPGRGRAALGLAPSGRIFVARTTGSAAGVDSLVTALKHAGCTKAVLLDRGTGSHGVLFRAGTTTPPRSRYEESTLYAMGKALLPRGFRFEAIHPVEQAPKKK